MKTNSDREFGPRVRIVPLLAAAMIVTALPLPVFGSGATTQNNNSPDATTQPRHDEEITVTATGTARPVRETPGQIDVVTSDEIEELGYTGVVDLVTFMPGVAVEGDPTRLGASGFTIRGIGGNRVLTQIDGVETSAQFDFGPLSVTQFAIDLDALESVEVVRSAGSALYGSDALGGVVSFRTRTPSSYLDGQPRHFGARLGYDGRSEELSESVVYAAGSDRWQGSILYTRRDGEASDNQGTVISQDSTRTAPNPIDYDQTSLLAKIDHVANSSSTLGLTLEWLDRTTETEVLSGRNGGSPFSDAVLDMDAVDTQGRLRVSLEHDLMSHSAIADSLLWRIWSQTTETEQVTDDLRSRGGNDYRRDGLLTFEQETLGLSIEARKGLGRQGNHLLTWGGSWQEETFDQNRDRVDTFIASGQPVPTSLVFPSKYFPKSDVTESALFAQAELSFFSGKLLAITGARYDRYDLDADEEDQVFLSGNPGTIPPVDLTDDSVSPKLGLIWAPVSEVNVFVQYARGFRAPPMNEVNNGFTNAGGGYRTLPNPDLVPETSDNLEFGLRGEWDRGSFSITRFDNQYDDFIELTTLGFNPALFLIEFQSQNVAEVSIDGFEVTGELRVGDGWQIRGAYSSSEGLDETTNEPLASISPSRLVTGIGYRSPNHRWGAEAITTLVESKSASDLPADSTQFRPPSADLVDLAAWFDVTDRLTLQLTGWNLTDETYYPWSYVRGQSQTSTVIDRYTASGRSFGAQARFSF